MAWLTANRVYALTGMNRLAVICFASVTVVQFVMGLVVASTWNKSGTGQPYTQASGSHSYPYRQVETQPELFLYHNPQH